MTQRIVDWESYPHAFVPLRLLADRWAVSPHTLRKWIHNGLLEASIFGKGLRVAKDEAMRFERSRAVSRSTSA